MHTLMKKGFLPHKGFIAFRLVLFSFIFFSCNNRNSLFINLSSSQTGITFENRPLNKHLFSILYYLYYYNGGGVATGDINNDGLPDIYFTANSKGNNKLYLNKGNFKFEDITDKAGVAGNADWCTGVTMADVNGDGFLDIYVSAVSNKYGLTGHNELFINNGNNTFTEKSREYGLDFSGFTTQTAFFDYDHDGDMDCYILNQSHHPHANIVDTSNRRKYDSLSGDRLYRNDLNTLGKFTDVSKQAGIYQSNLGYGLGIAVADLNNDGWDDIYIGNDFHENDYYYVNNGLSRLPAGEVRGDVTFTESGAQHFRHYSRFSMGNDIADYNNDGQPDVVTVDMLPPDEKTLKTYGSDENPDIYKAKLELNGYQNQYSRNCLQRNNGSGTSFSETGLISGISATDWSWSPLLADFDNDGNKDLFVSSGIVKRPVDLDYIRYVSDLKFKGMDKTDKYDEGAIRSMPDGASHPFLFRGDGKLNFKDVSDNWGTGNMKGFFNGASYADLDNDGKVDLVINCINAPAVILKNNAPKKNFISISFKGNKPNAFGIGCKAYVFANNTMQYQQLMLTRGFESSCEPRLHFGLDSVTHVDSLLVVWPDQKFQILKNIPANKPVEIFAKDAQDSFKYAEHFTPPAQLFKDITSSFNIDWKHREDNFIDYNVQYLIPHSESTRGPKIAVGDVNKDNLDDFYVCGAKGQAGALFIQQKNGKFMSTDTALFNNDALCEDVDAVFFDANGDGSPDLFVVSGGNEPQGGSPFLLQDRLYINDGKGNFSKKNDFLVQQFYNKSCVAVADVDHDGDSDLFVGRLASTFANDFGIPQTSDLFLNDGSGRFKLATADTIQLSNIGTVTSAAFADVNGDSWPDLIVTGEWMPVKIFINNKGIFTESDIPASTGLWQTVYTTDVNGDGFVDILAGNWGHNTKLWAGKSGPCKLYIKDFDINGSVEQIMCYTAGGKEYPFLAKDELERRLPVLKKAYLTYTEVAGKTVQYMFYDLFKDYRELKAEHLGSACFINDGKGNFKIADLPDELQLAPVFSFLKVNANKGRRMYLSGGNFFDVIPYEGRYDAQPLALFDIDNKDSVTYFPQESLSSFNGQVRDLKLLRTASDGNVLLVARNNGKLAFYKGF